MRESERSHSSWGVDVLPPASASVSVFVFVEEEEGEEEVYFVDDVKCIVSRNGL